MSDLKKYIPDNLKEIKEYFDTIMKNIYVLPHEEKLRACENLHEALSGKFSTVSVGIGIMDLDDFTITIRPNKDNLEAHINPSSPK